MCGIVGMVSTASNGFTWAQQEAFEQLLWADTLRGKDSTGLFGVNEHGNVEYIKNVGSTATMFETQEFKDFNNSIFREFHMVVGHNRKATKGSVTDNNAHPFVEGNNILVHNGTLFNHKNLTEQEVEVDSHAILHSIVERGYEETIKEIYGAFALASYNAEAKELKIIRNKERPLFIASTVGAWFFASEKGMLEWILGRKDIQIVEMTECTPGKAYTFKLDDKDNMYMNDLELHSFKPILPIEQDDPSHDQCTDIVPFLPKKSSYTKADFKVGDRITIECNDLKSFGKPTKEGYEHLFLGNWMMDPDVAVKCWATEEEAETLTDIDDDVDLVISSAEIMSVIDKGKGRLIVVCRKPQAVARKFDAANNEIFEDEFMFTGKTCQICGKSMSFYECEKGEFKFKTESEYFMMCEHCMDKGMGYVI